MQRRTRSLSLLLLVTCCCVFAPAPKNASAGEPAADIRVKVTGGGVEGATEAGGIRIFKGIPFAAPPVGDLRWKPPQPVTPWVGVKETTSFAPSPMQDVSRSVVMVGLPNNFSEDCLYLNVWTPAVSADERLPVMVWIYGGAFSLGSTALPLYDGARLAAKGVVVVSVAYRVGVFGFLAHPELSREGGGISGNYGLLDQIAGLRWVRDNIAVFGGDPGRVTIFGESAGGESVSILTASPKAKGLFQRAVSQSGGMFAPARAGTMGGGLLTPSLKLAEKEGEQFLADVGAKDLAAARALPAAVVLKARPRSWPVLDGDVLPGDQYELYKAGRFNDTPVLIGTNSDDGAMFVPSANPAEFAAYVRYSYGDYADKILAAYPHSTPQESLRSARDLFADTIFGWNTWVWARLQAEKGKSKAFVYYFDHRTPQSPDGANHAAEIKYVFRNLGTTPTPEDAKVSDMLSAYWVNFAKTGDPNGPGLPEWQPFAAANQQVMYLDGSAGMRPIQNLERLKVLDGYFDWRRQQAKNRP